jgi:hypothetical protein
VRPAAEGEKIGIPSVAITLKGFTEVARAAAKASGMVDLRIAEYPGAIGVHLPEIRENVKKVLFPQLIDALTAEGETAEVMETSEKPDFGKPVFSGSLDEINRFILEKEWSDGLPVIPPTPELVDEFLKYTDFSPDEQIAILPQANLRAVPINIAANAIMAGCRPEHMPIMIAGVQAIAEEHYNLNNIGTTWGVVPYLLVNGPIVKKLGISFAGQLISKGPNPAIGRGLGLIVRNIAGYRPGKNYMGTFGYPLAFALAENEEQTPWEPFHVEHGFKKDQSTVTAGASITWGWPPSPYSREDKSAAQSALELLCIELTKKPCPSMLPERGSGAMKNLVTLLLSPPVAQSLAKEGYGKADIRGYLYENARVPLREIEWMLRYGLVNASTLREAVESGLYPKEFLAGPDDLVRLLPGPDQVVEIVVCGDPGRNRIMTLWSGYVQPSIKEIKIPAKWDALV